MPDRLDRARLRRRMDEVLELVGLGDRADDRAGEYPGGMQRRLNIGIGLLREPALLILDEPTVGVDPQSRNAILPSVDELSGAGMAVLYTTHYMEEAERLCHRIGIVDEGRLVAEGSRRELVSSVSEHDHVRIDVAGDATRYGTGAPASTRSRRLASTAAGWCARWPTPGRTCRRHRHRDNGDCQDHGGRRRAGVLPTPFRGAREA